MAEKGKLGYWKGPETGFFRLRGSNDGVIVWAGPVGHDTESRTQRGQLAVRLDNGNLGETRAQLLVSDYHGPTGRLVLKGPPVPGEDYAARLVTMGQKNWRPDEGVDDKVSGTGREGAVNVFHDNRLAASLYVVPAGYAILQLRDEAGKVTITLDGGDGTVRCKQLIAEQVIATGVGGFGGGIIEGGLKNFAVPHPARAGYTLRYSALEGPEAGVFVRGTVRLARGRGSARLPRHFALLASRKGLTCNLTARSARSRGVVAAALSPSQLTVREAAGGLGSYTVDYTVFGFRKDQAGFKVVSKQPPGGAPRQTMPKGTSTCRPESERR